MLNNDIFKYCYWVSDKTLFNLKNQMLVKEIHMTEAKQNPCEALIGEIGYADSDIWSVICRFDAAPWYNKSKFIALINCPECTNQVSDSAKTCPHCGFQLIKGKPSTPPVRIQGKKPKKMRRILSFFFRWL